MDRVTTLCFLASYALALALELLHLWIGRPILRALALVAGAAGLFAQTYFLYLHQPPLILQFGWMLFVAWILAVFYLSGSIHYRRTSLGVFVLPLILGLLGMGILFGQPTPEQRSSQNERLWQPHELWGPVHALLLLLATVGLCIAFLASMMYLFQAHRLRTKAPPGQGLRLLSLERLEDMNRRAVVLSFPLMTAGVIAGIVLIVRGSDIVGWADPRVLSTLGLWGVFALMIFLRFSQHLRGRQVAQMTIVAFFLLLVCLAVSHQHTPGGGP